MKEFKKYLADIIPIAAGVYTGNIFGMSMASATQAGIREMAHRGLTLTPYQIPEGCVEGFASPNFEPGSIVSPVDQINSTINIIQYDINQLSDPIRETTQYGTDGVVFETRSLSLHAEELGRDITTSIFADLALSGLAHIIKDKKTIRKL